MLLFFGKYSLKGIAYSTEERTITGMAYDIALAPCEHL